MTRIFTAVWLSRLVVKIFAELRVLQRLTTDLDRSLHEIAAQLLELLARDDALQVQRLVATARDDERQVDLGLARARELALRFLGRVLQALERHAVLAQIDLMLGLEPFDEPIDHARVEIFAAEEGVARGRDDAEDAVRADLEDRDVERAAAEIVDRDRALEILSESIRERRRRRLVDDADDVEPRDRPRVFGRLALVVVEVRGDGDDRLAHRRAEIILGDHLHLLEDHRGDLRDAVRLVAQLDAHVAVRPLDDAIRARRDRVLDLRRAEFSADQSLRGEHRVLRVGDRLTLGDVADELLAGLGDGHHRRRRLVAAPVGDDRRCSVLEDGDAAVRRPEVDPDHALHGSSLVPLRSASLRTLSSPTSSPARAARSPWRARVRA
jgi:hypothetical protein